MKNLLPRSHLKRRKYQKSLQVKKEGGLPLVRKLRSFENLLKI